MHEIQTYDRGPGYRVYYALAGRRVVLLLGGADKRRQHAGIGAAPRYWQDWQRRSAPCKHPARTTRQWLPC